MQRAIVCPNVDWELCRTGLDTLTVEMQRYSPDNIIYTTITYKNVMASQNTINLTVC